jgi:hypothetical protein
MATYKTSLDINAPAGRVWQILTSFDLYHEWNPQIPRPAGKAEKETHITLRLALPGRPAMDLAAMIEQAKANQLVSWRSSPCALVV